MRTNVANTLDPARRSRDAIEFENALRGKVVGQDQAVEGVVDTYQMFLAGLNPPGRPVGNLLFLEPTGSGKTRVVEAMAQCCSATPDHASRSIARSFSVRMRSPS